MTSSDSTSIISTHKEKVIIKKSPGALSVFTNPRSFTLTVFIIFVLVFVAASVIAHQHYRSTLRHTINENKSTANILSNLIYEHQKAAIGILESYASRPAFVDAIQKKDFDQAIPRLKSLSEHHTEIDAAFITDQHGTLWANYPVDKQSYGRNLAYRDWYKGVSKNWRPYVSSAYRLIVLEKGLAVAVSVPIFDKKGKVIGILSSAQRTAFLTNLIKTNKLNPKKNITLLDQEGNIIYSDTINYEKEITKYSKFSLIQKTIRDNKNILEVPDNSKKEKNDILAFSPVRDIGWTIVVGEGKWAILKSETVEFIKIFAIAFLLFVCMTIILLLLQRELRYKKAKELLAYERQLRESEDKFRVLAESTPTAIMIYQNNKWVYANPAAERISGYSLQELAVMDFWAFVHPDYRHLIRERGQRRQEGEAALNRYEFKIISKDGAEKWVDLSGSSTMLGGRPAGIISVTDITERREAEENIKQIAEEWMTTFDSITDLISIQDINFKLVRVNKAYAHALKMSPEELIGKHCYEVIHGTACPIANCPHEQTLNKKEPASEEVFEPKLGVHLEISTSPVFNSKGEVTGSVHIAKDISERKKAEELIKISENKYKTFSTLTSDYVYSCVRAKDTPFVIDWISGAFEKITGYTNDELMQQGCWLTLVHPEDVSRVNQLLMDLKPGESDVCEFRIITKDGRVLWISDYNKCTEHEIFPDQYRLLGASQDITERKHMEESIQRSEQKYRSIFENAVEGIFQTTLQGRFLSANQSMARMLGYASPEELISSVTDIGEQLYVNPEDRSVFIDILKEKGVVENFELHQRKKDGSMFWSLTNVRTVRDEAGNILCFEGTHEDITPRKLAEKEVKQIMEKLRKSLAGTIQVVSTTAETRDPYTAGHQRRVSNLARSIAQEMGLSSDTVDTIRMAGIIHDIGKISVPVEILSKPGKISDIEMSLIKVHSQSGYDILKDVGLPYPVAEIVLQHHERLDGSGYPQGLKGDQILLEAQIISVADVVEAISSHRPYRQALGIDVALEEIEKNKSILYNEKAVEVCVRLFREKGFVFEKET